MPKVAYICADPGIPVFGTKGASIHVQAIIGQFLKRGYEVDLFSPRLEGAPPPSVNSPLLHLHALQPASDDGTPAGRELAYMAANAPLADALEASGPYDLVYERYSLWSHSGLERARERGWVSIVEVNAPLIEEASRHRTLVHRDLAQQSMDRALGAAGHVAAVSREVAEAIGHPTASVVPNGVDYLRFCPDVEPSRPSSLFTVGFVGNFRPWHGLDVLAAGMGRLQGVRLLAVGDGPERHLLEKVPGAELTGRVSNGEVPGLLTSMDVAVCPYPESDTFYFSPLKLFEYMAAGVPVVASRIGQISDVISHERTGLLVPPGDPDALGAAVERLRADRSLAQRLAAAARDEVVRLHGWDRVAGKLFALAGLPL